MHIDTITPRQMRGQHLYDRDRQIERLVTRQLPDAPDGSHVIGARDKVSDIT